MVLVWLLSPPLSVSVRSVRLPLRPARQPEKADHYRMTAIIVSALIEGACLFAIVVCLIAK